MKEKGRTIAVVAKSFSQAFALCLAGGAISQMLQRLSGIMYWYLTIFAILFIIATALGLYWDIYHALSVRQKATDKLQQ
jgi:hypothetical protein